MVFRPTVLAIGLCLGIASVALAQETSEQTTVPAVPAPQPEAEAFPVTPANPGGPQITKEKFGDWEKRCVPSTGECVINYLARDEQNNPVAEINIQSLAEGGEAVAGATVITPLGTLLTRGVRLQVDGGRGIQFPFGWCTKQGCFSRFGLAKDSVDSLKQGAVATITLFALANQDKPISLKVSLAGFTAAFESLPHK